MYMIILHNDIHYNTHDNNDYRELDDENNDSNNFRDTGSSNWTFVEEGISIVFENNVKNDDRSERISDDEWKLHQKR